MEMFVDKVRITVCGGLGGDGGVGQDDAAKQRQMSCFANVHHGGDHSSTDGCIQNAIQPQKPWHGIPSPQIVVYGDHESAKADLPLYIIGVQHEGILRKANTCIKIAVCCQTGHQGSHQTE